MLRVTGFEKGANVRAASRLVDPTANASSPDASPLTALEPRGIEPMMLTGGGAYGVGRSRRMNLDSAGQDSDYASPQMPYDASPMRLMREPGASLLTGGPGTAAASPPTFREYVGQGGMASRIVPQGPIYIRKQSAKAV